MSKKEFIGRVVSDKMQKTIVVAVDVPKKHPVYMKAIKNTKRFKARNEIGAVAGDVVKIEESRPYSKEVTWRIVEIIESESGKEASKKK